MLKSTSLEWQIMKQDSGEGDIGLWYSFNKDHSWPYRALKVVLSCFPQLWQGYRPLYPPIQLLIMQKLSLRRGYDPEKATLHLKIIFERAENWELSAHKIPSTWGKFPSLKMDLCGTSHYPWIFCYPAVGKCWCWKYTGCSKSLIENN